jgi:DNA polymerase-3 subunit gamma/tau
LAPGGAAATERIVDREKFREMAEAYSPERLFAMIDTLNRYQAELKHASQPQTVFEVALLKLCTLEEGARAGSASSGGGSPSSGSGGASSTEVQALRQQVAALERKIEGLLSGGAAIAAAGEAAASGRGGPGGAATRPATRGAFGGGGSGVARAKVKLEAYLALAGSPESGSARMKWGDVLQRVKEEKVTLHAWLKDGELVSVSDQNLLLAFKNEIHRETTEKPNHREIIERIAGEVLGKACTLVTVMQKDWQSALDGAGDTSAAEAGDFVLEHESPGGAATPPKRAEWIEEAVKLFGEDLVVVKDKS